MRLSTWSFAPLIISSFENITSLLIGVRLIAFTLTQTRKKKENAYLHSRITSKDNYLKFSLAYPMIAHAILFPALPVLVLSSSPTPKSSSFS